MKFEGDCPLCFFYFIINIIIVPIVKVSFLLLFSWKALFIIGKNHAASETIQNCVVIPKKPKSFTTACITL